MRNIRIAFEKIKNIFHISILKILNDTILEKVPRIGSKKDDHISKFCFDLDTVRQSQGVCEWLPVHGNRCTDIAESAH